MSMIQRLRSRRSATRQATRQAHAIDRALRAAPSDAMRNEILIFAQRHSS